MPITDTAIRNASIKDKPYKLSDEKGLYILVNKARKHFRLDYHFAGKRKTLAFGARDHGGIQAQTADVNSIGLEQIIENQDQDGVCLSILPA